MGKLFDALQKHEKEQSIAITERVPISEVKHRIDSHAKVNFSPDFIPSNGFSPKLFVCAAPNSIDAEVFNVIKGHVLFPRNGHRRQTIMVTSAFPGEGKTLVSANLAANLAMGVHESVLLVDCDLRRPSLHKMFGYTNNGGLHEYLAAERQLEDVLIQTKIGKLALLTAGREAQRPGDLLASSTMKDLLADQKAQSENHFVILDGVPSQGMAEAGVLANLVDGIVFVIMAGRSSREAIKKSADNLGKDKILGIVFNGYMKAYKSYDKYYKKYYRKTQ